jgi:hypothetical protein
MEGEKVNFSIVIVVTCFNDYVEQVLFLNLFNDTFLVTQVEMRCGEWDHNFERQIGYYVEAICRGPF